MSLTPKQQAFVREYLVDLNATQAAIRAGYSEKGARTEGCRLLANADVAEAIAEAAAQREQRTQITADRVLEELWAIATADPGEIVQHRRNCCRCCWGEEHGFQYTASEWARIQQRHEAACAQAAAAKTEPPPEPDPQGGLGYDRTRPPHPACPECHGEGSGDVFIADTRTVSRAARSLYAGVKQTKEGIEVRFHSKERALELLGKHLKLYTDRVEHDVTDQLAARLGTALQRTQGEGEG